MFLKNRVPYLIASNVNKKRLEYKKLSTGWERGKPTIGRSWATQNKKQDRSIHISVFDKMIECLQQNKIDLKSCGWDTFLIGFGTCIKADSFEAIILIGALDCFDAPRSKMLQELKMFRELSKREVPWIENYKQNHIYIYFT